MSGESGNGNGNGTKALWAVVLAAGTMVGNGSLWLLGRLTQMDDDRQRLAVMVEQRLGRVEAKLDRLWQLESRRGVHPVGAGRGR